MNSSLETSTEINLNITGVTEKAKTSLTETVTENVENILFDITNLTEESQYNNTDLNGTFSNVFFFIKKFYLAALKSENDLNDDEKPELNPTWMIIQITFVFVSICALILRSFYTICWEEKQVNEQAYNENTNH